MIDVLNKALKSADEANYEGSSPYHQDFPRPPQLPCKHCGDPAPDIEIFGVWRSLILCDRCQARAEVSAKQAQSDAMRSVKVLTEKAVRAGLTARQVAITREKKVRLLVSDWSRPSDPEPLEHNGALFYGPPGTGKTCQLAQLVKWSISRGWSARYVTEARLLSSLRPSASGPAVSLEHWERYSFVALDELGSTKCTEWSRAQLFAWLDGRYRSGKATAIATNLVLEQIPSLYGDGFASRLWEMAKGRIYRPDWDYRQERSV